MSDRKARAGHSLRVWSVLIVMLLVGSMMAGFTVPTASLQELHGPYRFRQVSPRMATVYARLLQNWSGRWKFSSVQMASFGSPSVLANA